MRLMKLMKIMKQEALIDSPILALLFNEEEMEKLAEYFSSVVR